MKHKQLIGLVIFLLVVIMIAAIALLIALKKPMDTDEEKRYISTDPEQCQLIKFICTDREKPFFDNKGCGCEPIVEKEKIFCPQEPADFCTEIYQPVCGWFDPEQIQCIKYPCAQTFSSGCHACQDENVAYYTEGECPQ